MTKLTTFAAALALALLLTACGGGDYGPDADTQPVVCVDHPEVCE